MSIQVRQFELSDLDGVIDMAAEFFAESPYSRLADFDSNSAMEAVELCTAGHVLRVAEKSDDLVGMSAALIMPSIFNRTFSIAQELVLYVRQPHRGGTTGFRLLKDLEKACKQHGADALELSGINGLSPDSYPGYTPHEQRYMRIL